MTLSIERMCREACVSRASFYRHWQEKAPPEEETEVRDQLQALALGHRSYGYRRLTAELKRSGLVVNHKRVLRLLRQDNLLSVRKRRFVVTTDGRHSWRIWPNLARWSKPTAPNQLWVSDITYLRLRGEFVYLAVILDVFSRRVIGWAVRPEIDTHLTLEALRMALNTRAIQPGLIHHSDRGVQYASGDYITALEQAGIEISMSRPGNPYDNAFCESFIGKLKQEQWNGGTYTSLAEARNQIHTMIEEVYNHKRIHSALGYLTPVEYEQRTASNSSRSIRHNGDGLQTSLAANLRLGLDPASAMHNCSLDDSDATVMDA
jgi:transposase InsO family protein